MHEKENGDPLKLVFIAPSAQIAELLSGHIEEVRPAIAELDRQQVRVVSKETA